MSRPARPPRLPRALAALCLRGEAREVVLGDLDEAFFAALAAGTSLRRARRTYWRQGLASAAAGLSVGRPFQGDVMPAPSSRSLRGLAVDLRYVVRLLAKSPGFVAVAVLSLAIGIGANVAMFNVMRALLFQDLPVRRPSELRWLYWTQSKDRQGHTVNFNSSGDSSGNSNYSYPAFLALKAAATDRADLFAFNFVRQLNVSVSGEPPVVVRGVLVSANYFSTLGLPVALGRPLGAADEPAGADRVAVISHGLWLRLFAGDRAAIGRTIVVNREPFRVVGVTEPAFRGLSVGGFFPPTDLTVSLAAQPIVAASWTSEHVPLERDLNRNWLRVMIRPRPGVTEDALRSAFTSALQRVEMDASPGAASGVSVTFKPGQRGLDSLRSGTEQPLTVLAVVSSLVLLIACTNLAGLMLARGMARQHDLAVRRALGASRFALARQWALESLLLAGAGGVAGVLLAVWSGPILTKMLTAGLGAVDVDLTPDWRLLAVALSVTAVTALLCGALPALRLTRGDSSGQLRNRVIGARLSRLTAGRMLIAAQIAVSVPLLVGALLFLRTLHNLAGVALGFEPHGLVMFDISPVQASASLPGEEMASPEKRRVAGEMLERLEALPGVSSATLVENPLASGWVSNTGVTIAGQRAQMLMNAVGPRFFETMRIPLLAGRELTIRDDATAPLVAVINRAAADQYFAGRLPLGETFLVGARRVQIVGVAANSIYDSLRRTPRPVFYDSYLQRLGGTVSTSVAVRTAVTPDSLVPALRVAVAAADKDLPITNVKTQDALIEAGIGKEHVFTRLLTLFGGLALVLTCIGLHGLTSYAVARRTSEIGIRLALGARRTHVLWLMLRQVVVLVLAGLALGIPAALAGGRFVGTFLYGVAPRDPWTIAATAALLLGVALSAGWLPARRAARMEALSALRQE